MTLFERHIIRSVLTGFVALLAILIAFFIVLHYVEYIDDFYDRGATMREVFLVYYPSYIPEIVRLISPLAIFLASIHLTAKLTETLQLNALQTSGVSLYRLMRPYVLVGAVLAGFMFWFNGWIVPRTNATVLEFEQQYLRDAAREIDINDIHRQNQPGQLVTVGYYDSDERVAHRVSIQQFEAGHRLTERLDAQRMTWNDSLAQWRIEEGVLRSFLPEGSIRRRDVAELDTTLNIIPRDLARTERDVESMTISAAADYVSELERTGVGNLGRTKVGYYIKFSYPLANLILLIIAVPMAAVRRRGGQAVQIGLGLAVAFFYLALQKLTEPFGYSGVLDPVVTAWLPHCVFAGFALLLLLKVRK